MMYLIFATAGEAQARSAAAWQALGSAPGDTLYLWAWQLHPTDGRAALLLPAMPGEAQIHLSQESYDGLLTPAERAARVETLPAEDWGVAEF
ncbi:hypothetical protein EV667_1417 [Ancylobacter aquaticus]|uniref:Uncharacterized protein n=1 Tax=Ancylobacter aquaticus TaxID=100 RepID=A0A4R1I8F3_ANCAQ|nr:hypothetical protein [Ancylobacter aquaticus]TCK31308.1 hypothetical protein EV667_1417 [Ancylobacter aquaticus]